MLRIWCRHTAYTIITVAQKFYTQNIVPFGSFVETAKQIVQCLHQFSNWQRHGQSRKIHNIRIQNAYIIVRFDAQITEKRTIFFIL